ncbi:hypothetical protein [Arthrobacter sp. GMC3]|uniref:hypothetical protein n=1 Tax=Arthrobacter sp. GMC3 TaxID=2058894 RepID=UPI000CE4D2EE|nr:hypothetical protein [Arthrobacter sp. GMC3]
MSDYQLGQRVEISGTVEKVKEYPRTFYKESALPYRENYPNRKTFTEGVIIGSRTIQDGITERQDEWGSYFTPTQGTARRVWLVAYDLRMKPVTCLDHQVAAVETGPTVAVPAPHVPYPGPHDTDATFMRGAARKIAADFPAGGSNVKRAVIKLLNDTADAMEAQ